MLSNMSSNSNYTIAIVDVDNDDNCINCPKINENQTITLQIQQRQRQRQRQRQIQIQIQRRVQVQPSLVMSFLQQQIQPKKFYTNLILLFVTKVLLVSVLIFVSLVSSYQSVTFVSSYTTLPIPTTSLSFAATIDDLSLSIQESFHVTTKRQQQKGKQLKGNFYKKMLIIKGQRQKHNQNQNRRLNTVQLFMLSSSRDDDTTNTFQDRDNDETLLPSAATTSVIDDDTSIKKVVKKSKRKSSKTTATTTEIVSTTNDDDTTIKQQRKTKTTTSTKNRKTKSVPTTATTADTTSKTKKRVYTKRIKVMNVADEDTVTARTGTTSTDLTSIVVDTSTGSNDQIDNDNVVVLASYSDSTLGSSITNPIINDSSTSHSNSNPTIIITTTATNVVETKIHETVDEQVTVNNQQQQAQEQQPQRNQRVYQTKVNHKQQQQQQQQQYRGSGIRNNSYNNYSPTSTTTTYNNNNNNNNNRQQRENAHKQLNMAFVQSTTANDILLLLQKSVQSLCAGGLLNSVNFSTSLHRLARQSTYTNTNNNNNNNNNNSNNNNSNQHNQQQNQQQQGNVRATILMNPTFALLITSLAEALVSSSLVPDQQSGTILPTKIQFQSRELSNVAWAIAKLKIAPPLSVMSHLSSSDVDSNNSNNSDSTIITTATEIIQTTAMKLRDDVTKSFDSNNNGNSNNADMILTAPTWIPLLSQLAGQILDYIGLIILVEHNTNTNTSTTTTTTASQVQQQPQHLKKAIRKPFRIQEWANLLWAWATAGRANSIVFGIVVRNMIQQTKEQVQVNDGPNTSTSTTTAPPSPPRTDLYYNANNNNNKYNNNSNNNKKDEEEILPQEWSNSIWAFATAQVYDGHEELLHFVANLMNTRTGFVSSFKSQELSNTAWGVATLLANKPSTSSSSVEIDNDNGASCTSTSTTTPGATITTSSLSQIEQQSSLTIINNIAKALLLQDKVSQFRTQELSNTAWAIATVGFGLQVTSEHRNNNYVVLFSDNQHDDSIVMNTAIHAIVKAAIPIAYKFRSQEINNLVWALARLKGPNKNEQINELLIGFGQQLTDRRRSVTSQDIGTTLWGLATMEFFNAIIYSGIANRLQMHESAKYKPQELSNTLWAFATAEIEVSTKDVFDTSLVPQSIRQRLQQKQIDDPILRCFAIAANELMKRPHQFKSQEIKDILWSFSKVGIRHPNLFKAVAIHLVGDDNDHSNNNNKGSSTTMMTSSKRGLKEFSPQGLGNCAWAFARQAQLAEDVTERLNGQSLLSNTNGRLAVYTTSYFDSGEYLLQRLFKEIAETDVELHDDLQRCKPQDLSNTCWSFAVLGMKHQRFLDSAKRELITRTRKFANGETNSMNLFKGQEIANLVWSFATLHSDADDVLMQLSPYTGILCQDKDSKVESAHVAKHFKRQELANMAWACAVFGVFPTELMQLIYLGLLGNGTQQSPAIMSSIYDDRGLQLQAIMTLVYVQAAMDLQNTCNGLKLPENFPEGWQQSSSVRDDNGDNMIIAPSFELNLSTSKMQRAVSASLLRIGFDHIEEHTITMKEMAEDYSIQIPPASVEILSIDLANVEKMIAIEVDGPSHYVARIDKPTIESCGYTKVVNGKLEYQFKWDGTQREMNGPTCLKQRLLKSLGWNIIHIPFWEWYALGGDATKEDLYCRDLLQ